MICSIKLVPDRGNPTINIIFLSLETSFKCFISYLLKKVFKFLKDLYSFLKSLLINFFFESFPSFKNLKEFS